MDKNVDNCVVEKEKEFPVIALQFKTKRWFSFTCLALYGVGTSTLIRGEWF